MVLCRVCQDYLWICGCIISCKTHLNHSLPHLYLALSISSRKFFSIADWFQAHLAVCVMLLLLNFFFLLVLSSCFKVAIKCFLTLHSCFWSMILSLLWNIKMFGNRKSGESLWKGLIWQFQMWILSPILIVKFDILLSFLRLLFFQYCIFILLFELKAN